jgi:hypothetical protein
MSDRTAEQLEEWADSARSAVVWPTGLGELVVARHRRRARLQRTALGALTVCAIVAGAVAVNESLQTHRQDRSTIKVGSPAPVGVPLADFVLTAVPDGMHAVGQPETVHVGSPGTADYVRLMFSTSTSVGAAKSRDGEINASTMLVTVSTPAVSLDDIHTDGYTKQAIDVVGHPALLLTDTAHPNRLLLAWNDHGFALGISAENVPTDLAEWVADGIRYDK